MYAAAHRHWRSGPGADGVERRMTHVGLYHPRNALGPRRRVVGRQAMPKSFSRRDFK